MRVLLNGMSMLGRRTGVGHYAWRLAGALVDCPSVTQIDVFQGRHILPWSVFRQAAGADAGADRYERIKSWVRGYAPFCRRLVNRFREGCFASETRAGCWQVYHEPNYIPQQFAGATVTTVCDMSYLRCPEYMPDDRVRWLSQRLEASVRNAAAVVAISEFTRRELLELFPYLSPAKVHVTHLGVDQVEMDRLAGVEQVESLRRRRQLPRGFVLYLGTLEPRKNLHGLVEGYRRLPAALQREFPLVLAGMNGWKQHYFRPALDALRQRGALHELGYLAAHELPALLRAATVFCFPSVYEGFGLPPLEAAAAGTPVVASGTTSLPEVLGEAAVYVDPHEPDSIASALRQVLESPARQEELRNAGRSRAAKFTWRRCAEATVNVYRSVA